MYLKITVRNKVPRETIHARTLYLIVIPRGTNFIAHIFHWERTFPANNSQELWFPWVPLEITVRNNAPARIFSLGTLFLPAISRGTLRNHIL
jgi:hypothetical protein